MSARHRYEDRIRATDSFANVRCRPQFWIEGGVTQIPRVSMLFVDFINNGGVPRP